MSWFSSLWGDISNAAETVGHDISGGVHDITNALGTAAHDVGHFTTNALGDVERAYSDITHIKPIRDILFAAPAVAAAIFAPEFLGPAAAAAGTDAAAVSEADLAAMSAEETAALNAAVDPTLAATSASIAAGVPGGAAATDMLAGTPFAAPDALTPTFGTSTLDPTQLFASAENVNPLTYTGGAMPSTANLPDFSSYFPPSGIDYSVPSATDPTQFAIDTSTLGANAGEVATSGGTGAGPSWLSQLEKTLTSPRGALTAASLASGLYGLLNKPQLPGAAKTALGAAGPAVAQATQTISSGGMSGSLWNQQKSAIDAQIEQQKREFAAAVQQNAANAGMGGANSDVVQQQIQTSNLKLEALRQSMYMQAAQQNVSNAVAELTGGNQVLMSVANLQFQEDQAAQQIAKEIGLVTGNLASLWPSTPATPGP